MGIYGDHVLPRIINVACDMKVAREQRARVCQGLSGEVVEIGEDVERRLPALSAFLGHGSVENTYWYLSFYPELRNLAAARLEKRWERLP